LLGLKKDDLIKTTKGSVGIVIATNKDNIKMLDTTNAIQIVGNLDYESKITTRNLSAKNKNGEHIENQTIVRIRKGLHEVICFLRRGVGAR
jgi:DNA-binding IscR family transcriptional regulator